MYVLLSLYRGKEIRVKFKGKYEKDRRKIQYYRCRGVSKITELSRVCNFKL